MICRSLPALDLDPLHPVEEPYAEDVEEDERKTRHEAEQVMVIAAHPGRCLELVYPEQLAIEGRPVRRVLVREVYGEDV